MLPQHGDTTARVQVSIFQRTDFIYCLPKLSSQVMTQEKIIVSFSILITRQDCSDNIFVSSETAPGVTGRVRPDLSFATSIFEFWLRKNAEPRLKYTSKGLFRKPQT